MITFLLRAVTLAAVLALCSCVKPVRSRDAGAEPALTPTAKKTALSKSGTPGNDPAFREPTSKISSATSMSMARTPTPEPPHDPLLDPALAKSCGRAATNPYGYAIPWATADGTCRVCEVAPVPLAVCDKAGKGQSFTESVLRSPNGRAVRLRGSLGFFPLMGTKIGGRCACRNTIYGFLRLGPANAVWLGAARTEPTILLGLGNAGKKLLSKAMLEAHLSPEGPLACAGDDASVCCPFELSHETLKAEVVVSGVFDTVTLDQQRLRLLKIVDICRVAS